ncbi:MULTISPECIES: PilW family protein [unclassified Massilia]|uniref:PilW family protein n=1 Tax=unclassified Massilia TaxID=2609279 RepID=UPI001B833D79|nr:MULTISPECIES: PilW family protein [unclassified Massilia]MBQ5942293.1 PilW family protein [Massilia sp. AB1]MBQ5965797.1 PilW family protein [Massilia sp. ZL223]
MNRRRQRQRGLSLVELMIAMALGLAVLLACGNLLIGATRAYAMQVEADAMDEAGRYALDALARAVRQSAHVDWAASPTQEPALPARIAGLDARSVPRNGTGIDGALPDSVNGSDVLALRFPGSGAPPNGDGGTVDCAGFPVHAGEDGWSIFYVARNAQGEAELRCKYRGNSNWSADAVAGRVDGFQVLYGLDGDGDRVPDRYVNASTLAALDAGLVLNGANPMQRAEDLNRRTHWKRVAAVRVALLLHGPRLDSAADMGASYALFGPDHASAQAAGDPGTSLAELTLAGREGARIRKVYSTTVALPAMPE